MEESIVLVDEKDIFQGAASKKECHLNTNINKGLLHRAFSAFVFNQQNHLLLQQRAAEKITFPLKWTNTCCSHMWNTKEETEENNQLGAKRAAQRKLNHELGIPPHQLQIESFHFLTRIHYKAYSDDVWGEHEMDYILFTKRPEITVHMNPNECKAYRWISQSELRDFMRTASTDDVTPWFKLIFDNYLDNWWTDLDSIQKYQDNKIHKMF